MAVTEYKNEKKCYYLQLNTMLKLSYYKQEVEQIMYQFYYLYNETQTNMEESLKLEITKTIYIYSRLHADITQLLNIFNRISSNVTCTTRFNDNKLNQVNRIINELEEIISYIVRFEAAIEMFELLGNGNIAMINQLPSCLHDIKSNLTKAIPTLKKNKTKENVAIVIEHLITSSC